MPAPSDAVATSSAPSATGRGLRGLVDQRRLRVELLLSQQAEYHPLRIHDHAGVPTLGATTDVTDRFRQAAARYIRPGHVADPDLVDGLALARLVLLVPGLFAGLVVDHPLEPE